MGATLHALRVMAQARRRMIFNSLWRAGAGRRLLVGLAVPMGLFGAWLIFLTSRKIVELLAHPPDEARVAPDLLQTIPDLVAQLPALMFLTAMLVALLSSVASTISGLFFSSDLELLLTAPIPVRAVFLAKLFEGLLSQYMLLGFLAIMPLAGYGAALGYGARYFLMLPVLILATPLIPTALGAILSIGILRIVPPRRAKEIISLLSGLIGIGCYIGSQVLARLQVGEQVERNLGILTLFNQSWQPHVWAGRALVAAGRGDQVGFGYLIIFVGLAIGMFVGGAWLVERIYHTGWLAVAGSSNSRIRRKPASQQPPSRQLAGWLGQAQAIARKDGRLLPRDMRMLSQMAWPVAFAAFWLWSLFNDGAINLEEAGSGSFFTIFSTVFISYLICSAVGGRLAMTGISREGRSYWIIQTAPVESRSILAGKMLIAWLPYPLIGAFFLLVPVVLRQTRPLLALVCWLGLLVVGLGATAIQVGMGASFPVMNWEQPEKMVSKRAGCLSALLGWTYVLAMVLFLGLLSAPWALSAIEWLAEYASLSPLFVIIGGAGALISTMLAVWLPLKIGAERLETLEG